MTYSEIREIKKQRCLGNYEEAIANGDYEKAYNILRFMMRCKLIGIEDDLVSKENFKMLSQNGVDIKERDIFDYRGIKNEGPDTSLIPESIFMIKNPSSTEIVVTSLEHWIERRELQYVGHQIAPEKRLRFMISRDVHTYSAKAKLNNMHTMFKKLNKNTDFKEDWDLYDGSVHMWDITLGNNQAYVIKHLGYVCTRLLSKKKVRVYCVMDFENMDKQFIDIIDTYDEVTRAFEELYKGWEVELNTLLDIKSIGEKQRKNRKPILTIDEFARKEEEEYRRKQLEDEASKRFMTVEALIAEKEALKNIEESTKKEESK